MKAIARRFTLWLMSLTTLMRYFVVAVLFHVLILFVLGSIKIVSQITKDLADFKGDPLLPAAVDDIDPTAALRDFNYSAPSLGDGRGTTGPGAGGTPTAKGDTRSEYKAMISKSAADNAVGEIIGVLSDSATAAARLQGDGLAGLMSPTAGFGSGNGQIATSGIQGPGGNNQFGQRQGPQRSVAIDKYKSTKEAEKSVLAALRWLKEHQEPDGSWSPAAYPAAKTGLAALCFLGHGETPDSEEFGPTISRALTYLAANVGADGIVKSRNMYEQGIVTLALAEAYGMTQSPLAREPLDRAVNAILLSQRAKKTSSIHEGGWRYSPNSSDSDSSVAGWNIMGLKSAKLAGMKIPEESLDAASKYLWNMYGDGQFGYIGPGPGNATTAVGILCEQFLGHGDDKRIKKSLEYYMKQKVNWDAPANSLYGWYYVTQAMFQAGGSHWTYWNHEIRDTLVKNQASDGHWDEPGKDGAAKAKEPVFSTTLCCLMLEVYYRYLPIYQDMEHRNLPATERVSAK